MRLRKRSTVTDRLTRLSLIVAAVCSLATFARAQPCEEAAILRDAATPAGLVLGTSVALDLEIAAVGGPGIDGGGGGGGAVYVYRRSTSGWSIEAQLTSPSQQVDDGFGSAVAILGSLLAVGAPGDAAMADDAGAVWVFRYDGNGWNAEARLDSSAPASGARFGSTVAITGSVHGDAIAVGAPGADRVRIFRFDGQAWSEEQSVSGASSDSFGSGLGIADDELFVGAPSSDIAAADAGAVFVYGFDGNAWTLHDTLTAAEASPGAGFGGALSVAPPTLAVGAEGAEAVHAFAFDGNIWIEEARLFGSSTGDGLGAGVGAAADAIAVGAPFADDATGLAFLYRHDGNQWTLARTLRGSDAVEGDAFGSSVALSPDGGWLLGGSPFDGDGDARSGAAYALSVPDATGADCNDNGIPDACDIAYGSSFDCNANGIPDECDIASGAERDCNDNGMPDSCDIASGVSADRDRNGIPDDCCSSDYPGVVLFEGMLAFDDLDAFNAAMTRLHEENPRSPTEDGALEELECSLGFHSLRAEIAGRMRASELGNGSFDPDDDPDEHFVPSDYLRTLLSPGAEIKIGTSIWVLRPQAIYEITDGDLSTLEIFRSGGIPRTPNVVATPSERGSGATRRKDCYSNESCSQSVLYGDGNRRMKMKVYVTNALFYAEFGAKTTNQSRTSPSHSWKNEPADYIAAEFDYDGGCAPGNSEVVSYFETDKSSARATKSGLLLEFPPVILRTNAMDSDHTVQDAGYSCTRSIHLQNCSRPSDCVESPSRRQHIRVKRSNGDGTWTAWSQLLPDGSAILTHPSLAGDFDGDGRVDLAFVGQDWNGPGLNIRTKSSNGDGTWSGTYQVLGDGVSLHTYPALTGDVDADERTDLLFVGQNWSGPGLNIRVKRSDGDGTWTSWSQVTGDGISVHTHPTLTGDVDGDGRTDLLFVGQGWSGPGLNIRVKRSDGDGTWTSWSQILGDGAGVHTHSTLAGDVDADGRTDLVFVGQNWSGLGLNVRVKRSNGNGTWTPWSQVLGDGASLHTHPAALRDVDGDGRDDLIFVGQGWSGAGLNVRVKFSNGDGTWSSASEILGDGASLHVYPMLTGRVDLDDRIDLIFQGQGFSGPGLNIRTKFSDGDGTWSPVSQILGDGSAVHARPPHAGDVDGDGRTDVIYVIRIP